VFSFVQATTHSLGYLTTMPPAVLTVVATVLTVVATVLTVVV
jgi:hypothetical protein